MKLAYIGFDRTATKTKGVLGRYFSQIDYYLMDRSQQPVQSDFLEMPVWAENLFIPPYPELQTSAHKRAFAGIEAEYKNLKKEIYNGFFAEPVGAEAFAEPVTEELDLRNLNHVRYDSKAGVHEIGLTNEKPKEYDYLIIQGSQLLTDFLLEKTQNVLYRGSAQQNIMLNLEFPAKLRHSHSFESADFIFVDNIRLKNVFDNWYLCRLAENKLKLSLLIPVEKKDSLDFVEFLKRRSQQIFGDAFSVFEFGECLQHTFSACDGYVLQTPRAEYAAKTAFFPAFSWWSQSKVDAFVRQNFSVKNKTVSEEVKDSR